MFSVHGRLCTFVALPMHIVASGYSQNAVVTADAQEPRTEELLKKTDAAGDVKQKARDAFEELLVGFGFDGWGSEGSKAARKCCQHIWRAQASKPRKLATMRRSPQLSAAVPVCWCTLSTSRVTSDCPGGPGDGLGVWSTEAAAHCRSQMSMDCSRDSESDASPNRKSPAGSRVSKELADSANRPSPKPSPRFAANAASTPKRPAETISPTHKLR